jgi:CBS domain-containing protein
MATKKKKAVYTESHRGSTPEIEFTPSHDLENKVERPKRVHSLAAKAVKLVMTPRVVAVTSVTFLPEAAQIMLQEDVGALPVVQEDGTLLGIITDRDITVRAVAEARDISQTQVGEVYTAEDLVTVSPETDINEAQQIMAEHQVRRLPIVEPNNRLVGMVSLADLTQHRDIAANVLKGVSQPGGEHQQ